MKLDLLCFIIFLSLIARSSRDRGGKWQTFPPFKRGGRRGVVSKHRWFGVIFKQQALETHIWPTSALFRAHKGPESFQTSLKKVRGQFQARSHIHMFVPPPCHPVLHTFFAISPLLPSTNAWNGHGRITTHRFPKFPVLDRLASSVRVLFRCLLLASGFRLPVFRFG